MVNEVLTEVWRPGERKGERGNQSDRERHSQCAKESTVYAGCRDKREENNDWRQGGTDKRNCNFLQRLMNGVKAVFAGITMKDDVLDDDDGVVNDEANSGSQSAKCHQVETFTDDSEHDKGDQ